MVSFMALGLLIEVVWCSLAGDFGFDPLGLGEDPKSLKWYVQAELVHCRFAMAGVAGILLTDVSRLGPVGQSSEFHGISILNFMFRRNVRY